MFSQREENIQPSCSLVMHTCSRDQTDKVIVNEISVYTILIMMVALVAFVRASLQGAQKYLFLSDFLKSDSTTLVRSPLTIAQML